MQVVVDRLGDRRRQPRHVLQLGEALPPARHARRRVRRSRRLRRVGPSPGIAVEGALGHAAFAQLAVERDGETVSLVPRLLQEVDGLAVAGITTGSERPGDEDLLQLLGERGDGNLVGQAELLKDLYRRHRVVLSSVQQKQLWRVGEREARRRRRPSASSSSSPAARSCASAVLRARHLRCTGDLAKVPAAWVPAALCRQPLGARHLRVPAKPP